MQDHTNTILVVEDNKVFQDFLSLQLKKQGYEVLLAENGQQALDVVKENDVDLVILDILMPGMDGFQVLEYFKEIPELHQIPVVVTSALDDMESIVKCIELGADDYIIKPINQILLQARVETSLSKKRLRDLEQALLQAEKIETEEVLKETEKRLQTVVSNAPIILFSQDSEGKLILSEGRGLHALNLKPGELGGDSLPNLFSTYLEVQKDLEKLLGEDSFTRIHEFDNMVWEVSYSPTRDEDGELSGAIGVAIDITERKNAEREKERLFSEVSQGRERLRKLSERLVEIQEEERRYLARELHDEVGQSLTGLKISFEMGLQALGNPKNPFFEEAQTLIDELLTLVRDMSLNLRPTMLDDLGILPTLIWHIERFTSQTNIQVDLNHINMKQRFNSKIETAIYRLVQEALTNIARYAGVDQASVHLSADTDLLAVMVEDNGKGFDAENVLLRNETSGLTGMVERVNLVGGDIIIESSLGKGTHILAKWIINGQLDRRKKPR